RVLFRSRNIRVVRLIWIRNSSKAVRRGQKSVNRPNEQFNTSFSAFVFLLPSIWSFLSSGSKDQTVRDLFHPFQDCINLRIKTHTTKNKINNRLLLWQRGVQWFQPAVPIYTDFSGKMSNPLWKENVHSSYRKTLPSSTISS